MGLCVHNEGVTPYPTIYEVNKVQPFTITIRFKIDNINVSITNKYN
jgi:hypothetical protein